MANIVELREMSDQEIEDLLESAREEMFNLRFQRATGSLENTARLKQVRREIARLSEILSKRAWAVDEVLQQPEVAAALADEEWSGTANYDYVEGLGLVSITSEEDGREIATAKVDLNKKRRRTRRQRDSIPPVQKIVSLEVAS